MTCPNQLELGEKQLRESSEADAPAIVTKSRYKFSDIYVKLWDKAYDLGWGSVSPSEQQQQQSQSH